LPRGLHHEYLPSIVAVITGRQYHVGARHYDAAYCQPERRAIQEDIERVGTETQRTYGPLVQATKSSSKRALKRSLLNKYIRQSRRQALQKPIDPHHRPEHYLEAFLQMAHEDDATLDAADGSPMRVLVGHTPSPSEKDYLEDLEATGPPLPTRKRKHT
jgi:hypothetical protein